MAYEFKKALLACIKCAGIAEHFITAYVSE